MAGEPHARDVLQRSLPMQPWKLVGATQSAHGLVPSHAKLEPDKLLAMGGDNHAAAPRGELEGKEAPTAADAGDATELRRRMQLYVYSVGLVTVGEEGGADIYAGALRLHKALTDADSLKTLGQVRRAVHAALCRARRECNRQAVQTASIGQAYIMAAAEIDRHDFEASQLVSAPAPAPAPAPEPAPAQAATTGGLTQAQLQGLSAVHNGLLRRIANTRLGPGGLSNGDLFRITGVPELKAQLDQLRLRRLGHIARMPDSALVKQLMFAKGLSDGSGEGRVLTQVVGRPRPQWFQHCMESLSELDLQNEWYTLSQDRRAWRELCGRILG